MPVEKYQPLLTKIQAQGSQLSALSANYELEVRTAYLAARDDINTRIGDLISSRGGLGHLSGRDRWRLTRDTSLLSDIEGRITALGGTQTSIVTQAFTEAGQLSRGHKATELAALTAQINEVSGSARPILGAVDFAQLDTASIELGLGTALNDTTNLTAAQRVAIRQEVTAGVASGEGIDKLARRVDDVAQVGANRAEMITRWSTIKGYNLSAQVQYESAETQIDGLKKMWLTQTDERACPHCLALHGTVVEIRDEFDSSLTYANTPAEPYQGELEVPPLHPRCRCTITSWHESWRAYTEFTPEELHATGRDQAIIQEHPRATDDLVGQGVLPQVGIQAKAQGALGEIMRGVYVFDDFSGSVRLVDGADINEARAKLRNAGFRVRSVDGDDLLFKIDFPQGIALPRMIRSTKLRALHVERWDQIKSGLLACARRG